MATTTTVKEYTGDGSDKTWSYTFQSYQKEDIKVSVTNASGTFVDVTNFTIPDYTAAGGTVTFNNTGVNSDVCESDGAPTNTRTIRIRRETDITTGSVGEYDPKTTHQVGSSIRAGDLNNNQKQALYAIYEVRDQEIHETKIRDGAVTSDKIADGTIANVDISATAEIEVSKLKDGTARQLLQTDSGGTGVEWTSNVDVPGTLDVTGAADFDSTVNVDGTATFATVDINGGAIDGTVIGAASAVAGSFTTVNASGTITGNVTGNLTGDVTGDVTGDLTGNADTATDLAAAAKITASEENGGITANDTTYFTTSASDARYYQIGTSDDIDSTETWNSSDVKVPTTKAVDARVITLVDEVGGFVPITNETDFPATNPDINSDAGTIVSIGVLSTSYTSSGSGVITIPASTLDNLSNDLTITGAENSTTYGPNFGMLVETKALSDAAYAAAPSYTFHRLVPKASEVTTLAGKATELGRLGTADAVADMNTLGTADVVADMNTLATGANVTAMSNCSGSIANINTTASNIANVNNFSGTYQIASSAPANDGNGAALAAGDLYFDTSSSELKVRNAANDAWQGGVTATGSLIGKGGDEFTGAVGFTDGSTSAPSIYNVGDTNTGIYFGAADEVDVTVGGSTKLEVNSTGLDVTGNIVVSGTVDGIDVSTLTATPEGTAVISTGESGGTKFLREDGDGTCSWQTVTQADTTYSVSAVDGDDTDSEKIRLTAGGSGSGTDDVVIAVGTGLSIARSSDTITITNTVTDTTLTNEAVQDVVGAMFSGNTETGIAATYEDDGAGNGTIDLVVTSQTDENFTTADHSKLDGIEASADVTDATNVNAAGAVMESDVDAKGDIFAGTADNTVSRLAVGTNTHVLTADSSTTTGLTWSAPSVGTITALNNQAANRLTTIGSTTTQLDGEANLTFEDTTSTGLISGKQITGRGFECPATVADDWTIAAANNAMFPGPMTIASAKTVTVPAGRTLTIV